MVNHGVEQEELQAYLDGELTPARQAEVERHLGDCRECGALVEDLKRVSATLQHWQVEPAPTTLRPLAVESVRERPRWWNWQTAAALAATAAVVLVVASISLPNLMRSRMAVEEADRSTGLRGPSGQPTAAPPAQASDRVAKAPAPPAATYKTAPEGRPSSASELVRLKEVSKEAEQELAAKEKWEPKAEVSEGIAAGRLAPPSAGLAQRSAQMAVADEAAPMANRAAAAKAAAPRLIAYHVALVLEVKEFDAAKQKLQSVVEESGGYVAQASSAEAPDQPRRADLVVRVPVEKLSSVLEKFRALGRVTSEQLTTDEVTEQAVDLEARLRNARATEDRLVAVLKERTGKVRDILEVEREIARTREEIERMDAQRENLMRRVEMATIELTLLEEFKAQLQPAPVGTGTRLRNAFVEGYENFAATILSFVFFFARHGLNLLFWSGLLWLSGRLAWRLAMRRLRPLTE